MFLLAVTVTELLLGLIWVGVVLVIGLLLKIEIQGFFLSGIHPLGVICWGMTCSAIELLLWLLLGKLVLVLLLLLLKFDACGLGSFLSGIHPLGIIWWALAGTVIELLIGLLWIMLVLTSVWLLAVIVLVR